MLKCPVHRCLTAIKVYVACFSVFCKYPIAFEQTGACKHKTGACNREFGLLAVVEQPQPCVGRPNLRSFQRYFRPKQIN